MLLTRQVEVRLNIVERQYGRITDGEIATDITEVRAKRITVMTYEQFAWYEPLWMTCIDG